MPNPARSPPTEIYSEGLTRANTTGGVSVDDLHAAAGHEQVVRRFIMPVGDDHGARDRMTVEHAEHDTSEERARIIAVYPPHDRDSRANGVPVLGSGRIFPVGDETALVEPFGDPAAHRCCCCPG